MTMSDKPGSKRWNDKIDRVVKQTSDRISGAMDEMVVDLPEGAAPQMAIELVVRELAQQQTWLMGLIMEDPDIREAYAAAVAELPATGDKRSPGRTG